MAHLPWRIGRFQSKYDFLLIGTNNLQFNTDKEILQGILQVTEAIKIRQPQAKLCVMGILPRANTEKRIQQINKELRKKLEQDCIYINLSNLLTDKMALSIHPYSAMDFILILKDMRK